MVKFAKIIYITEIFVFGSIFYMGIIDYSQFCFFLLVIIGLFNIALFIYIKKWNAVPTKFGILSTLFSLGYLIVFYQKYIDLIVGNIQISDECLISSNVITKCILLSNAGYSAFVLGFLKKRKINFGKYISLSKRSFYDTSIIRMIYYFATFLFTILNWRKMYAWSYSQAQAEMEAGTWVQYSDLLFQISYILLLAYIVNNCNVAGKVNLKRFARMLNLKVHFCLFLYCFIMFMIGDRGPLIICSSAYFGAFALSSNYSLKKRNFIILLISSAIVMSLIGSIRSMDRNISMKQRLDTAIASNNKNNTVSTFTNELASSVITLHYAVDNVPEKYDYMYGTFVFRYALSCIPFADDIISSFWNPHWRYRGSAFFITWLIQGEDYSYGNGTCCNADLYLGFGILGVIIGLFLWGRFYSYLESSATNNSLSILMVILYLFTLGYAFYVCRASFLSYSSDVVFAMLLHFINVEFTKKHRS